MGVKNCILHVLVRVRHQWVWFIVAQCPHRYDPHINKWMEVAPMAKRRAGVGLAALNGYLYAVGGFDDASPLETVERLVGVV